MAERSSRTRSPIRFKVNSSRSPAMATLMTCFSTNTSSIKGFSASSGKVSMASTAALISSRASDMSVPGSSSAMTVPRPSAAVDVIFLMPSMLSIDSSTLIQTPSSTSAGAAPRYSTFTEIMSVLTVGNTSRLAELSPVKPATTIPMTRRLAATLLRANQ